LRIRARSDSKPGGRRNPYIQIVILLMHCRPLGPDLSKTTVFEDGRERVTGGLRMLADTELGEEARVARVKAAATIILDEYLQCQSSVDAALFVEELSAPE
jgi:hypothetical protein